MDDQSLRNILSILRYIQSMQREQSASQFLVKISEGKQSSGSMARMCANLQDQFDQARAVIVNSQLVDEAKAGIISAIDALSYTFSVGSIQTTWSNLYDSIPGYISNLVILLSAAGLPSQSDAPSEAVDFAREVDEFVVRFEDDALDPVVRDIAKKHMVILATLIRHVPIFGLEAALSTYFDLVLKLRRADSQSSEQSKGALDRLIGTVTTWGERIQSLDKMMNAGANLIDRAKPAGHLLQYIPHIV